MLAAKDGGRVRRLNPCLLKKGGGSEGDQEEAFLKRVVEQA
jgi:hypothetical protein